MTRLYAVRMRYQRVVHLVNPFDAGNEKVMAQIPQSDLIKMEAVYLQQEPSAYFLQLAPINMGRQARCCLFITF